MDDRCESGAELVVVFDRTCVVQVASESLPVLLGQRLG